MPRFLHKIHRLLHQNFKMSRFIGYTIGFTTIVAFTIFFIIQFETNDDAQRDSFKSGPTPSPSSNHKPLTIAQSLPIQNNFGDNHRSWHDSTTLIQDTSEVSGNPFLSIRKRIVRDSGFTHPVLLEENVIRDPITNEEFTEVRRSMIANQLLLSSEEVLFPIEIENRLINTGWSLKELLGSGHTAVLEYATLDIDAVETGLRELQGRFINLEHLQLEPNIIFYTSVTIPNDPLFTEDGIWGLDNQEDNDIDAPEGWDEIRDASALTIAIVDSGIRLDHEDLDSNLWRNSDEIPNNDLDDDENGYIDDVFGVNTVDPTLTAEDDSGHGTHVAGIVGAVGNNGIGVTGVAWNANLMAVKFMNASGRGSLDDAVEAIDYAVANGANIINASWGSEGRSSSLDRAMERAGDNGVFIVAAAGNESDNIDRVYYSPASSDLPNVITVASIDVSGHRSPFSNYGIGKTDLTAPGSQILSTWADSADAYSNASGTSMAAPLVTGILALNMVLRPDDDMQLQVDRLVFSSKKRPELSTVSRSQGIVSLAASLELDRIPLPPVIEGHTETSLFRPNGETVEMSVTASSELPVTYEWQFNDSLLEGENTPSLLLESLSEAEEGTYKFTARNEDGEASVDFNLIVLTHNPTLAEGLDADQDVEVLPEFDDQWSIGFDPESRDGDHIEGVVPNQGQTNNLRTIIKGPGLLRFFWKLEGVTDSFPRPELQVAGHYLRLFETSGEWDLGVVTLEENKEYELLWRLYGANLSGPENGKLIIDHLQVHAPDAAPPLIYHQPADITARPFQDFTLSAFASGADLIYDWYKADELIYPDTGPHLSLRDVTTIDAGIYHVVVSNAFGSDTSRSVVVEVDENQTPAHFIEWTKDVKGVRGEKMDLTLDHGGSPDITYKWYKNHYELPGESGPTLSFNPLRMEHAGNYEMEISNAYGPNQRSQGIWLQVVDRDLSPAALLGDRDPYTIESFEGDKIEYDYYIATEFLPVEYQWYRNGIPVEGQTSRLLTIENATYEDSGEYFLEFKNNRGSFRGSILSLVVQFDAGEALDFPDVNWEVNGQEDRGWKYPQREVSYDGEDAFEFARRYEFEEPSQWDDGGFSEFLGAYFTGPLNLSAYWKRSSDASWFEAHVGNYPRVRFNEFPTEDRVAIFAETGEVGDWQRSVIHVPEGEHFVTFRFVGANPHEKGWLDQIEITDAPTVVSSVPRRIIVGNNGVSVNAQASGAGTLAYQWFKNGEELAGENSPTLQIDYDAFEESDRFYMTASSEFGETASGSFQLTPVENLIETHGRPFNFGGESYWERNPWGVGTSNFKITLKPEEAAWMEFEVEGPAVVSWERGSTTAFLDGNLTTPFDWTGPYSFYFEGLNIPAGVHTVRLSYGSQPGDSASRTNYLSGLLISEAPIIINKDPLTTNGVSEYRQDTAVYFAGASPLTVKWYKDDLLLGETTRSNGGLSRAFEDWEVPRNPSHAGIYYCEIVDANGATRRSEDFIVRDVDTKEIGEVIGDEGLYVCDGYYPVYYDTAEFIDGEASAYFTIPGAWEEGYIKLCSIDEFQDSFPAFELSVRMEGYDDETIVQVFNGNDLQLLELTDEWQNIKLAGDSSIVTFRAEKSLSSDLTIWFDGVSRDYDLRIIEEPQHFATYFNGAASFSVEAFSDDPISYQWQRNGENIPGANATTLEIEQVSQSDLGSYQVLISSGGSVVSSKAVFLSIAGDLGAAIEYPGLRIRTWGDNLWEIDETISIDGTNSLRSGDIGPGESSHIEIEFDFPGMFSIYHNSEYANEKKQQWEIRSDTMPNTPFKLEFQVSLKDGLASSNNYIKRIRLDRLSYSAFASQSYEEWLSDSVTLASDPNAENSLFDETADADGDGIPNFLEYLFDLDPFQPSQMPSLTIDSIEGQAVAELSYRFAANGESTVKFETSHDLLKWELLYPENTHSLSSESQYYDVRSTATIPVLDNAPSFIRWTASKTENTTAPIEINDSVNGPSP